jgi:hypothetical protein
MSRKWKEERTRLGELLDPDRFMWEWMKVLWNFVLFEDSEQPLILHQLRPLHHLKWWPQGPFDWRSLKNLTLHFRALIAGQRK